MPFIISSTQPEIDYTITKMRLLDQSIQHFAPQNIMYEERGKMILLTQGLSPSFLEKCFTNLCKKNPAISIAVGSLENSLNNIYKSHQNAWITYEVGENAMRRQVLCYDDIGAYQLLTNLKDSNTLYPAFVEQTLGKLISHDNQHRTDYMDVLKLYFDNNCSITQTANESFYHQNTLKYKIKAIKEILGYDITTNENRVRIMLSLYILKLGNQLEI